MFITGGVIASKRIKYHNRQHRFENVNKCIRTYEELLCKIGKGTCLENFNRGFKYDFLNEIVIKQITKGRNYRDSVRNFSSN